MYAEKACRSPATLAPPVYGGCARMLTVVLNRLLDSVTMSYWRKLFVIVLLLLSLPVQSFAAISMQCGSPHAAGRVASVQRADMVGVGHVHPQLRTASVNDSAHEHHHGDGRCSDACSTCLSCCPGAGAPLAAAVPESVDTIRASAPRPAPAGPIRFLTDGIERPPRVPLA
jgi:hypothetical protein